MKQIKNYGRFWSLLLVVLLSAGLLAACGDSTTAATGSATTVAATTVAATTSATTTTAATSTTVAATTSAAASTTTAVSGTTASTATTTAATSTTAPASGTTAAPVAPPTPTTVAPIPQPAGSVKITFWYGLTGSLGNVVQQTVNKYNSSQSKYYVEAVQQPSYDDTINKLNTNLAGSNLPNVAQIYDIGTQRMIDTKKVLPVQDFIDKEGLDIIKDIEPAVARYYTVGGKLYSMPFNSSAPVMYFNKTAFKEVGLDPEKKVWTYDEVLDAAKKLTKKSGDKITRSGVDFTLYSWIFEQELATQTTVFADPDNGRNGRATNLVFNNEAGANWLNFLKKLQDDGVGRSLGRDGGANSATRDANFVKGEAAITFNSIAGLRSYITGAQQAGGGVDVGVAYIPRPTGAKGGVVIGGASLWITNTGTPEQQAAAWDFVKWTSTPEVQASWSSNTGYYPIRQAAYNVQEMKDTLAKYPQFQVAIQQLRDTEASPATQGAVFGTFVATRAAIETAMEGFMTGKFPNAKAALDDAAKKANDNLSEYNSTVR